ncbi:MAG: type I DNA topoisomerase [Planctomycetota bacterium]|nr:type I DNA topoisomerase [Planctomycetota bacterium]
MPKATEAKPKSKPKPKPKAKSKAKAKSSSKKAGKKASPSKGGKSPKRPAKPKARSGSVVIVESPAKARTIAKYLGKGYSVKASMGHVRDLPRKTLGVDIENGFEAQYQIIPERKKNLDALRKLTKGAEAIYLATDRDREGEAIAWHLVEALKIPKDRIRRVVFNEITGPAIRKAFEEPHEISSSVVNAQQARRVLDRIVGYQLSPLLWEKVMRGLSAGRVQSVAVKLIVDRQKAIDAFDAEEYWYVDAKLKTKEGEEFTARLKKKKGEEATISNEAESKAIVDDLLKEEFKVTSIEQKDKPDSAPPPYSTSTLQQRASIKLRFSAQKTMLIAQQLYEGIDIGKEGSVGLITYMRTDSLNVAESALEEVRSHIESDYGQPYVPAKANRFKSKKGAQEAHEAVRATSAFRKPEELGAFLTQDQFRLYRLIWERFVASQMTPAVYAVTRAELEAGDYTFVAQGRRLLFDGHAKVTGSRIRKDEQVLPAIADDEKPEVLELLPSQHFTEPPPPYSEATLVKTLEKEGIGRPSTYAPIISLIQKRGYVERKERMFHPTDLGVLVTDRLTRHFPHIMDTGFTSKMEDQLDEVEEDKADWRKVLEDFYKHFASDLEKAKKEMRNLSENPELSDEKCEKCDRAMAYKWSKGERFLGCIGYPECRNTKSLKKRDLPEPEETPYVCEKCESPMVLRTGRNGRFLACSDYPKCKNTKSVDDEGKPIEVKETGEKCEKCGSAMVERSGRRGKFLACSAYPKCRNTKPLPGTEEKVEKVEEKCEKCGKPMAIRRGPRGQFIACTGYPACKNSKPVRGQRQEPTPAGIDCDECGSPMVFRFSRRGRFIACSAYPTCRNTKSE